MSLSKSIIETAAESFSDVIVSAEMEGMDSLHEHVNHTRKVKADIRRERNIEEVNYKFAAFEYRILSYIDE
jgi:hypothetical protein